PEKHDCGLLQDVIRALKGYPGKPPQLQPLAEHLIEKGAQGIILGCTELGLIAEQLSLEVPIFDSIEILAHRAIQLATEHS
ncbi:MAG: aspartate/glutamate racemase family protein, partial [bacterium]